MGVTALIARLRRRKEEAEAAPRWTADGLRAELDRIEAMLLEGDPREVETALQQIDEPMQKLETSDATELGIRHGLLYAELASDAGRRDLCHGVLERERTRLESVLDERLRLDLQAWLDALAIVATTMDQLTPRDLERGRAALDRDGSPRPEMLLRLAWAARYLGMVEQTRGSWERGRALLERCTEIAARFELPAPPAMIAGPPPMAYELAESRWAAARACGSASAALLAEVELSLQHLDEARRWYARSVDLLEGARGTGARRARAHALLTRAIHEPLDVLERERRRAWLEAVIAEAPLADAPDSWGMAARAAIELGTHDDELGLHEQARGHWKRALEFAAKTDDEGRIVWPARTRLELAEHHEERGALEAAKESLRQVLEHVEATHPEARRIAVEASLRLHGLLLAEGAHAEAGEVLERAEKVLPTLVFEARPTFVALHARAHGVQLTRQGDHDQAVEALERAGRLAVDLGGSNGVRLGRWIESDLGQVAVEREQWSVAETHVRRALDTCPSSGEEDERADLMVRLAQVLVQLDREPEALRRLDDAFRIGGASGTSRGRETAAAAHFIRAEIGDDSIAERRNHLEAAVRLGRLSGRPRGREIAERAASRLREMV